LPLDARIKVRGEPTSLIDSPAFAGLKGRPGIAVVDFAHRDAGYYGCVVTTLPVDDDEDLSSDEMVILLDLPAGSPAERARLLADRLARAEAARPLAWHDDYAVAMAEAERERRMMLVVFGAPGDASRSDCLEADVLANPAVREKLRHFVRVRLPMDATILAHGRKSRLIDDPAFAEMLGRQGIAILDFAHQKAAYHGTVVSMFPILGDVPYSAEKMLVILDLPPGTLTQRTLIYAVRTHPERPQSASGQLRPELSEEAERHSGYQARIRLQGHHQWGSRFPRISALLPGGLTASEVCAESWPGEGLLAAAIECVRCWRQSSGHWRAVRSAQPFYGYDMKRGSNGIWYATGVFGGRN
jgi:hypothetical protein